MSAAAHRRGRTPLTARMAAATGAAVLAVGGAAVSAVLISSSAGAATGVTVKACLDENSKVVAKLSDTSGGGTYFAALVGANHTTDTVPTSADVGSSTVTVRLNGDFFAGDRVQVSDDAGNEVASAKVALSCGPATPSELTVNWTVPAATQNAQNCKTVGDKVSIGVTLQNKTDPTSYAYRRATGLDTVPYTLAVLNPDQTVADVVNSSAELYNDNVTACVTVTVSRPTAVQVKAVSIDGVVKSTALTVTPAAVSSSPGGPRPSGSPTRPSSSPTSGGGGTATAPSRSEPAQPSVAGPSSLPGGSSAVVAPPNGGSGSSSGSGAGSNGGSGTGSSSANGNSTSGGSGRPTTSSGASASPRIDASAEFGSNGTRVIADPPMSDSSHLFVWQKDAALIVLVDALAIAALVGGVVVTARRR